MVKNKKCNSKCENKNVLRMECLELELISIVSVGLSEYTFKCPSCFASIKISGKCHLSNFKHLLHI